MGLGSRHRMRPTCELNVGRWRLRCRQFATQFAGSTQPNSRIQVPYPQCLISTCCDCQIPIRENFGIVHWTLTVAFASQGTPASHSHNLTKQSSASNFKEHTGCMTSMVCSLSSTWCINPCPSRLKRHAQRSMSHTWAEPSSPADTTRAPQHARAYIYSCSGVRISRASVLASGTAGKGTGPPTTCPHPELGC